MSKAASHDNAACMQNLRRCMSCSSAFYIYRNIQHCLNVGSTTCISALRSYSCDTMYQSLRSSIVRSKCAGIKKVSCRTRRLLQQETPLPAELTVQSFSDFDATQLRNVTAAQATAASAAAAASAAVAAVYHISECCIWDSAGTVLYYWSPDVQRTTALLACKSSVRIWIWGS